MIQCRLALFVGLFISTSIAFAEQVYAPTGSNLSYGYSGNTQSIYSYTNNPAMGASALKDGEGDFKMGLMSFGVGYELGDLNNITDTVDEISKRFDNLDVSQTDTALIQSAVNSVNEGLGVLSDKGTFKFFGNIQPVMPLVIASNWLSGALVFDLNVTMATKGSILFDPVNYTVDINNPINGDVAIDPATNQLIIQNNDSTLLAMAAVTGEFSLGYSRLAWSDPDGDLYGGLRLKMLRVGLGRIAVKVETVDNGSDTIVEDSADEVTDTSSYAIDIGAMWASMHYRIGASIVNLNAPSFEYPQIDLAKYIDPDSRVRAQLVGGDTYTLDRQLKLEGAWYSESRNWIVNGSMDANAAEDPFGDPYKWMVFSAAYASERFLIPGLRAGYRKNTVGSNLSYLTAGLTLFNFFNLDIAYGLEKVEIEGETGPRSAYVNAGFSLNF